MLRNLEYKFRWNRPYNIRVFTVQVAIILSALPVVGQGYEMTTDEIEHIDTLSSDLRVKVLDDAYEVWASGASLRLFKGTRVLDGAKVTQYHGIVQRIDASADGRFVFVDGRSNDWLVEVVENQGQSPELVLVPMPQFYSEECGSWKLFNYGCDYANWEFDPVSGTMTVEGYRKNSRQSEWLTIPE